MITVTDVLAFEEGYRENPYYCSEGYPTVGIGKRIGPQHALLSNYEFSVSREMADIWLDEEVEGVHLNLCKYPWYSNSCVDTRIILTSMAYQMGVSGILKFKGMIKGLSSGDNESAAREALDSRWARQTPGRAARHARVLGGESIESVYGGLIK